MKRFIFSLTLLVTISIANAQTQPTCNPYPKTISVTGSAEMEVIPDEIYVQIDLHEYKKKGGDKVELDRIKSEFLTLCNKMGIPDSTISIASYDGNNSSYAYWKKKKADPNLYANIAYQIKFKESKTMDKLVDALDDDATANFQVVRVSNSKIQDYRSQLKIEAIKAAREKANNLTRAIQEHLSNAITITEPEETPFGYNQNRVSQYSNSISKSSGYVDTSDAGVDFKKIKLRYEVKVLFALM